LERLTIAEAAKQLDLTQEAIRQRVRRGTIEHEKGDDGKTYVYLTEADNRTNTDNSVENAVVKDYINALKSQIESVEQDRDEWREEARRKDHIIMALTQRIPELEPAPEPRESTVSASEDTAKGDDVPPDTEKRSWWQRMFGVSASE
jgi:DNA-binding transcriptional MerR regulator